MPAEPPVFVALLVVLAPALIGAALLSLLVYPTAARVPLARAPCGAAAAGAMSART